MERACAYYSEDAEVRFLEYRLDVISCWPPSAKKRAIAEAISRRLAAIGRASLGRPGVDHLMSQSCRLLDNLFVSHSDDAGFQKLIA